MGKNKGGPQTLSEEEIERCKSFFVDPSYLDIEDNPNELVKALDANILFNSWHKQNVSPHKNSGYAIVTICLKETGIAPGDVTDTQLDYIADLADEFSFSEVRVTHHQNLVFPNVEQSKLYRFWQKLKDQSLASMNLGLLTDMICCPGGDFCALANAKSIPIAESIQREFKNIEELEELGELRINISGCMNACGHHHVGNIGILGVDKKGEEFYQVSLGGSSRNEASLGKIIGPSFAQEEIPVVLRKIVAVYRDNKEADESFLETYKRVGINPFKEKVYAKAD